MGTTLWEDYCPFTKEKEIMTDYREIAIADVLKHPRLGLVSHQPILRDIMEDSIRVKDLRGNIQYVLASECDWPLMSEIKAYWREVNDA